MNRVKSLFIAATMLTVAAPSFATIEFARGESFTVGRQAESFCVGDFNRDGIEDLALAAKRSDEVDFLIGSADGKFTRGTTLRVGRAIENIACGDLNQDCEPDDIGVSCEPIIDIAVADAPGQGVRGFWMIIGRGDGTFETPTLQVIDGSRDPHGIAIGDVNNDGANDVVVSDVALDQVVIMLNDGGKPPKFEKRGDITVGDGPETVVLGDFDDDAEKDLDIAVLNTRGPRTKDISILRNDGNIAGIPVFRSIQNVLVGEDPYSLQSADINGDGVPDLIMGNNPAGVVTGEIEVLLAVKNRGSVLFDGPFKTAVPCPFENDGSIGCRSRGLGAGDFDQDGVIDVAVSIKDGRSLAMTDFVTFFRGRGDANFFARLTLDTDPGPRGVVVGNFALNDDFPDVVVSSLGRSSINLYVNLSVQPLPDGEMCTIDDDCASEVCVDNICCSRRCLNDETCAVPGTNGQCVPLKDNGEECTFDQECFSNSCVDGVCCSSDECPEGERCDIFGFEGMCRELVDAGGPCDADSDCTTGFCVDGVCCLVEACFPDERCSAPDGVCVIGPTPTRTPGGPGSRCEDESDCESTLFCTNGVCCVSSTCAPGECGPEGVCLLGPTRTRTETPIVGPTLGGRGTPTAIVSRGGGCETSQGHSPSGMELLLSLLLPAGLWISRRRPLSEVRVNHKQ